MNPNGYPVWQLALAWTVFGAVALFAIAIFITILVDAAEESERE